MSEALIHPWYVANFYQPLWQIGEISKTLGVQLQSPEERLWEARYFAGLVRECNDVDDIRVAIQQEPVPCGRFLRIAAQAGIQFAVPNLQPKQVCKPISRKPYSSVANLVIWILDMLEAQNPGMTIRKNPW